MIGDENEGEGGLLEGSGVPLLSLSSPPLPPHGPPEFIFQPPTEPVDPTGVYRISFRNVDPSTDFILANISALPITAAILRFVDLNNSAINYLWLVSIKFKVSNKHIV